MTLLNPTSLMYELPTNPKIDRLKAIYIKIAVAETDALAASPKALEIVLAARLAIGKLLSKATYDLLAERKND